MTGLTRRGFLEKSLAVMAGSALLPSQLSGWIAQHDAAGRLLEILPFLGERGTSVEKVTGSGLGGRLAVDLSKLGPGRMITPNQQFFIRTRLPDGLKAGPSWSIEVGGLADRPLRLSLENLLDRTVPQGVHLAECSGNSRFRHFGLISTARTLP